MFEFGVGGGGQSVFARISSERTSLMLIDSEVAIDSVCLLGFILSSSCLCGTVRKALCCVCNLGWR